MALPKLYELITWINGTTPALNEDNLNAMSQAIDDIDDRVIDLAGTIMEDVPQIQEDMEILEPAIESIDENVARAEAAAESAEQYAEEIAPPIEVVKDFAPIITVEDAINKAAKDVKVKVEAVQDLHGYTKPWVGGAGKNKIPMTVAGIKAANTSGTWSGNVYTIGTLTFTIQTKDDNVVGISVNGSRTSNYYFVLGNIALGLSRGLSTWDNPTVDGYTVSSGTTGDSGSTYGVGWDSSNNNAYIVIRANASVSNKVFYPQIEVGTSATAFESYTNICPITGHSQAKVTGVGKNLMPFDFVQGAYISSTGDTMASNDYIRSNKAHIKGGVTYILTKSTIDGGNVLFWDKDDNYIKSPVPINYNQDTVFTAPTLAAYFAINVYHSGGITPSDLTWVQLEPGETATPYEPYEGQTFTINLNGTRYGGVLDVDAGTLTLTHVYKEFTSTDATTWYTTANTSRFFTSWTKVGKPNIDVGVSCISSSYKNVLKNIEQSNLDNGEFVFNTNRVSSGNDCIVLKDTRFNTAEDFKASLTTPLQLVYELATPQTITLTAEEVTLLWAYNTLWADTGDIALTYDASGVLRIANAKLDIDTFKSIVAASSDFSDFKSRVAAL